jgi:hypothetical protein
MCISWRLLNSSDLFQCIIMEGLRISTENSEYKDSRSVSQDGNLGYPRFEEVIGLSP